MVVGLTLAVLCPRGAAAQFMYLDANVDQVWTEADCVVKSGVNAVDVWLVTDRTRAGSAARVTLEELGQMTFNSYEVIVRSVGGTVEFGKYTNAQPSMNIPLEERRTQTELHVGYLGPEILKPGKYRLGRFTYRVVNGDPMLVIADRSELDARFRTSFGSQLIGADLDNTLKLASSGEGGDWRDAVGLAQISDVSRQAAERNGPVAGSLRFAARAEWSRNGGMSVAVITTKEGRLKITLFDVAGRLVRTVADQPGVPPGTHEFSIGTARLSSGVYFYRVSSAEGELTGRCAIVK